ncbi:hypothetical protein ANO14919_123960 [Xylariales sp. No.14919]|nr:hypothetical protein ANO14919_123960 [Xylariales sp. No.14919]
MGTSNLSPTERWVYEDQGTSGPYDAIGEVEMSWANNSHGGCSGDYGGFATLTAATQGSAKVKTQSKKREKESSKQE